MTSHQYGKQSTQKLGTCHPALRTIADEALSMSPYDITIVRGWSGKDVQNALYDSHASTKRFPDSRHNRSDDLGVPRPLRSKISDALDFAPYVNGAIPWGDTHIFAVIAGCFMAAAKMYGHTLRWGGDWDSDGGTKDQTLMDWGHIEIIWTY